MIKKLLFLLILIMMVPVGSAFSFEKNYYIILDDTELNQSINKQKMEEFDLIENIMFNNNFCNKYYLKSYRGNLVANIPFENIISFNYNGAFHLYLYSCEKSNIFNFKFESNEINDSNNDYSRFVAYKPEYIYFNEIPINEFINTNLKKYIYNHRNITIDRNNNLFEFITVKKSDFKYNYTDDFCKSIGYYLVDAFYPATFSDIHKDKLCKTDAYSLLNNHFLYLNEIQGIFISDFDYDDNYNFEDALESILIRKLAEKSIYKKYYNQYQTKNPVYSSYLTLTRPYDKSDLYDIQSKNVNLQKSDLLDLLNYIDNQLRVSKYNELAITRIDRKNEMLNWLAIIIALIGGITLSSLVKKIPYRITFEKRYLFRWDEIPGNDTGRLIEFLRQKFKIDWVKTAKIEKFEDGKTIRLTNKKNYLLLRINDEKTNANLKIDDGRTAEFATKLEDGKLNIYEKWNKLKISRNKESIEEVP